MGSGVEPLAMATKPSKDGGIVQGLDETEPKGPKARGPIRRGPSARPGSSSVLPADPRPGLPEGSGGSPLRRAGVGNQAIRVIRTGKLHALPRFHIRPINVVVFHDSHARPGFEGGFPLRCFQRLSCPHLATRRCGWRHNRYTRGASIPVLSY